jgi:hypothetical protein
LSQARKISRTKVVKTKTVQQTEQSANKAVNPDGWRTVRIEKWGVESLSLPNALTETPEKVVYHKKKGKITSTYYSQLWEFRLAGDIFLPSFEVTIWIADDFVSPKRITPELKLSFIHRDHEDDKKRRNNSADEVKYLDLDGLRGSFFRFQDDSHIRVYWSTYRRFNNGLQSINVSITANESELQKVMMILNSLKFQ